MLSAWHRSGAEDGMACWLVPPGTFQHCCIFAVPALGKLRSGWSQGEDGAGASSTQGTRGKQEARAIVRSPLGSLPPTLHPDLVLKYRMGVERRPSRPHRYLSIARWFELIPPGATKVQEKKAYSPSNRITESHVLLLLPKS